MTPHPPSTVILVGNYAPDGEESMQRYFHQLADGLPAHGFAVTPLAPRARLGRFGPTDRGLGKFLGYVDKFVLFPRELRRCTARAAARGPVLVHVCDSSNALYVAPPTSGGPVQVVTCHDAFPVLGAVGLDPRARPRLSGRILQRQVLAGLRRADHVVAVSPATARQLARLGACTVDRCTTVWNGLAPGLAAPAPGVARSTVAALDHRLARRPTGFLFHIGHNHWYKNRGFVLDAYFELCRRRPNPPALVLAGKRLDGRLAAQAAAAPAGAEVVEVGRVDDLQLSSLYASAAALFFPSLAEGFGWPVLEAMACGCPVITSRVSPLVEIAGTAALLVDPTDPEGAATVLDDALDLTAAERGALVAAGHARVREFPLERMVGDVAGLHRRLLARVRAGAEAPSASLAPASAA